MEFRSTLNRMLAVTRLGNHFHVRLGLNDAAQLATDNFVVIDNQNSNPCILRRTVPDDQSGTRKLGQEITPMVETLSHGYHHENTVD